MVGTLLHKVRQTSLCEGFKRKRKRHSKRELWISGYFFIGCLPFHPKNWISLTKSVTDTWQETVDAALEIYKRVWMHWKWWLLSVQPSPPSFTFLLELLRERDRQSALIWLHSLNLVAKVASASPDDARKAIRAFKEEMSVSSLFPVFIPPIKE